MKRLIFASIISPTTTYESKKAILDVSYVNNSKRRITGVLLYDDVYFLECVEGKEKVIDNLFKKISQDTRHYNIKLLGQEPIEEQMFSDWILGFINREQNTTKLLIEYTSNINFKPVDYDYQTALKTIEALYKADNILS